MTLDAGRYLHAGSLIYGSVRPLGQCTCITTSITSISPIRLPGYPSPWRLNLNETGLGVGLTWSQRCCGINTVRNKTLFLTDQCWEHENRQTRSWIYTVLLKGWDEDADFQLFRPTQDRQSHTSRRVQPASDKHGCWRAGSDWACHGYSSLLLPKATKTLHQAFLYWSFFKMTLKNMLKR